MDNSQQSHSMAEPSASGLVSAYRPLDGVPDEMVDAAGRIKPAWAALMSGFEHMGPEELANRFERADQYLRDAGVFYRKYDESDATEREWPLAHIPILIDEREWAQITAGLAHRADLLEAVVRDIYGPAQLVEQGFLPPSLLASNPEFLRPMVGVRPATGHFLHFCAFDLGRGPDGRWWVLGDRAQAPSGAGFALENRVATTRALADIYGSVNVHRLAGFFRHFRDALLSHGSDPKGRIAILTPGPHNDTYFEHAYIARYLGFSLLEGEDLTVTDGEVMIRTVAGLRPVKVLWRRMDAAFMDPLELRHDSHIGTPGFMQALRGGTISMVNALGSGILETRALAAFLPHISEHLTGKPLELPSVATWWCGQETARAYVMDNLDRLAVGPALSTQIPFEDSSETVIGSGLDRNAREALRAKLADRGHEYVGQEAVKLSTAPVYVEGKLEPRPITVRVFAARTRDGWQIMPGGFGRVGFSLDAHAFAMQRGGQAADVWVVSDKPVPQDTLLARPGDRFERLSAGNLPSRAADNLIWLGRYIERCEFTARVLRAYHVRLAETGSATQPALVDLAAWLNRLGVDPAKAIPDGLVQAVEGAVASAGRIRDRFSPDGWLALRDLEKTVEQFIRTVAPGDDAVRAMTILLRKLAGFAGLVHENMYRFTGWRFLEIGRRIERAAQFARIAAWLTRADAPDGALEMLLEIGDSVMTHRRRYNVGTFAPTVIDLLVLDPLNPRSVQFQLEALRQEIDHLPGGLVDGQRSPTAKEALRLETSLAIAGPADMTPDALNRLARSIEDLAELLSHKYHG